MLFVQVGSVHFSVSASPDTVYVGQQISYEASLGVREQPRPRFLEPPEYTPSDIEGVEVYTFPFDTARSIRQVTMTGGRFTQYTYHSAVFPLTSGDVLIPPSTLAYTLLDEADPYASQRTTVQGASKRIVALPLPMQGRPTDFSGAVGQFTITAAADSQGLRVGHAFDFRVTVTGVGDVALLQPPAVTIPWATTVGTSASVTWDFSDTLLRGSKEFHWLVTPQSGGNLTIPQTRYSYFDPKTRSYATTAAAAISLAIAGDSAAPPPRHDSPAATLRSQSGPMLGKWIMLLLGVVALAGLTVWGAVRRRLTYNS